MYRIFSYWYMPFFHPDLHEFTWSNRNRSSNSRIDLFLLSSAALQFVKDISHSFAPLSDHKQISLKLCCDIDKIPRLRGYWKFNNSLLKDASFCNGIVSSEDDRGSISKWIYLFSKCDEQTGFQTIVHYFKTGQTNYGNRRLIKKPEQKSKRDD